jgi:hypothetical protein
MKIVSICWLILYKLKYNAQNGKYKIKIKVYYTKIPETLTPISKSLVTYGISCA